jgi:serine/threonine protein kinase
MERGALQRSQHAPAHASTSARGPAAARRARAGRAPALAAHLPDLAAAAAHAHAALALAYEPVVLPCSSMSCGDVVHRASLDPALRMELRSLDPRGAALVAAAAAYLLAKPGVLQGMVDTYAAAPLQRARARAYTRDDLAVGRRLAVGGFGTVYRGELADPESGAARPVIAKRATEFGEAEVWMNERVARAAPGAAAAFVAAFPDGAGDAARLGAGPRPAAGSAPLWLVWEYAPGATLAELMASREFPANLEALLFERPPAIPDEAARRAATLRAAARQLLECLRDVHAAGLVHRDVKPQNTLVVAGARRVRLIDFGAAADLRVGANYVPNLYLLDPRYAPPQSYLMDARTPAPPAAPLAALLSPVLWALNAPDRFDLWSVGVVLLQMALPPLRSDAGLAAFNRALAERHGWDLAAWRAATEARRGAAREWAAGFATLDALGGGGWDLALRLMRYAPRERPSAAAALAHPWFEPGPVDAALAAGGVALGRAAGSLGAAAGADGAGWLARRVTHEQDGALTESDLADLFGGDAGGGGEPAAGRPVRGNPGASATVAWWKERAAAEQAKRREARSRAWRGRRDAGAAGRAREEEGGGGAPAAPPAGLGRLVGGLLAAARGGGAASGGD